MRTTIQNNLHGIPTDTPVHEKNGWTADAHLVAEAALHHLDLHAFLRKWLRDHADAQAADGSVPQIVPTPGWGCALDPTWSASYPLLTWNTYFEYGDRQVLEEHVEGLLRYVRLLHRRTAETGLIWVGHSWGDWLAPGHHFPPEGPSPTSTLMMLRSTERTADICDVLGRRGEAAELRSKAAQIACAYHAKYFDLPSGTYLSELVGYRQSMNVLPLAFGVVPPDHVAGVVAGLVRDLTERTNEHLDVGSIATKHLLPVLTRYGHHDLAMRVATQPTRPGWGLWKAAGSQTLWESWDANVRSHNHFFLGSIDQWIHEDVAGLRPTEAGWRRFDIAPRFSTNVGWVKMSHETVRGNIGLAWSGQAKDFELSATVPPNSVATLILPPTVGAVVLVNGKTTDGGRAVELPPGHHLVTQNRTASVLAAGGTS